jgi:hypothetical protein
VRDQKGSQVMEFVHLPNHDLESRRKFRDEQIAIDLISHLLRDT